MTKILSKIVIMSLVLGFMVPVSVDGQEFVPGDGSSNHEGSNDSFVPQDGSSDHEGEVDNSPEDDSFVPEDGSSNHEGEIDNSPEESSNTSSNGGGGRRRSRSNDSSSTSALPSEPTVLGASTGPNGATLSCAPYMIGFAGLGKVNDEAEVKKLQSFLNEFMGESLPVTGVFGPMTHAAVMRLQAKYSAEILKPWDTAGLSVNLQPTGYAYIMTRWFVNTQVCKLYGTVIPLPDLKKEVAA